MVDEGMLEALRFQRAGFEVPSLASPLYAAVLDAVIADVEAAGPCAAVLQHAPPELHAIDHALVLRFLGALHRVVLRGEAPALARWYPTAGGAFRPGVDDIAADVVAAVEEHHHALVAGLSEGVQTNEVGRCAVLAVGFTELLRRFGRPLRLLEVGASGGLNLRWDRWRYESGATAWGDPGAPLRFAEGVYREPFPDVSGPGGDGAVAERRGCDRSPIDPSTAEGRALLRSFVWPDQAERHARLDAALAVAAEVPATVEAADAGEWVEARLAEADPGVTTVVYHSIVWQYLPIPSRERLLAAFEGCDPAGPVAWLRMEPPDDQAEAAELRLTVRWDGERTRSLLARCGYHGRPVWAV